MSKFPFVSIDSIANKVAMGPFGSSIKVETFTSEGIPIISGAHLNNVKLTDGNYNFISPAHASNLKNSIVHKKDIIFTHAGNIGQVSYIPDNSKYKNYIISQRQFYLRCNERALPEYVAYYFKSRKGKFSLLANSSQVGVPSIAQPVSYLKSIKIPLPEKKVQLAIVNILCSFDKKIELNRQMNETLEQMAQAVFQDWFVDFGPVKRKLEGINDPVAILGGLIPNPAQAQKIASLFPDQFAEDGLPEGWVQSKLGHEFNVTMGQSPPGSTYNETNEGLPFFQGRRDFGFRFPKNRVYCNKPSRIAEKDWTLVSVRAPVGDINRSHEKSCIGRGVSTLIHKSGLASYTYYYALALRRVFENYNSNGTVFGSINKKQLEDINILAPNLSIVQTFDDLITGVDQFILNNTDQNHTLAEMRDLLLPKLMSGEISVDELEKKMGGVL